MNNYHLKNRTYQFILLQNKAYHDNNKSNTKPLVKSRPQSANFVRKSSSSLSKILRSSKNYDQFQSQNNRNGPLTTSNQNLMNSSNQNTEYAEPGEILNRSYNQMNNNAPQQRPQSASTDYFYRKYRSLSSYNSTINKENNKMSANSTLQVQPLSFSSTPMSNTQFRTTPNSALNNSNNGLFSSKSKSSQTPSNKSLNSVRRKIEQRRIEESNLQLLKSLSQVKPQVKSKRALDRDFEQVQKYKTSLSNFKSHGQQKPKIVIMNKEYLAPILSSYIDKKNLEQVQSPKVSGGYSSTSNNFSYLQNNQPIPPKRFFRRAQNHYNNGYVNYDDEDDTVNIKKFLNSNTQLQQNPNNYQERYDQYSQNYPINQNQQVQDEEQEYRKAVFESHYSSNGNYQNSYQQDSENYIQQLYQQQNHQQVNNRAPSRGEQYQQVQEEDDEQEMTQQSPQFNQQIQYEQDAHYNQQDQGEEDNYDEDENYPYEQDGEDHQDYDNNGYYHLQDRRTQLQHNQNVMMVRDLVNQMDSDQLQPQKNQRKNIPQNNQYEDEDYDEQGEEGEEQDIEEEDDEEGQYTEEDKAYKQNYQYNNNKQSSQINQQNMKNNQKPTNNNNNYEEEEEDDDEEDENHGYYDAEEEVEEELENESDLQNKIIPSKNISNNNKQTAAAVPPPVKEQSKEVPKNKQTPNNGLYIQNQDNQYDEDFEEVYDEEVEVDLDEEEQNYYTKSSSNYQGANNSQRQKGNHMNLQLNQPQYGRDTNFQEEEIIEEVDDEESNTKSNKVFSIRNSKGYIKNSNSQVGRSQHELSDHQHSNQQSMFNTPSFIQD